jgi:ferrous iron transport protein B
MNKKKEITVALAGQPNCGKSTMFNAITGSKARVGNYPGITVDRTEGYVKTDDYKIKIIDLPGTYSLTSYSVEELVARNVILQERPDVTVCMLDSVAIERSLYLVVQLIEMGVPVIVGLNMMDEVRKNGIQINSSKLAKLLNVPVIECIAKKGKGKKEIIEEIVNTYESKSDVDTHITISYGTDLDPAISKITEIIKDENFLKDIYPAKWLAIKFMEEDSDILKLAKKSELLYEKINKIVKEVENHTEKTLNTYPEAIIADYRYGFIHSMLRQDVVIREEIFKHNFTEAVDKVLTQRFLGPIIMLGVLYLLFWLTFTLGAYPQDWLGSFFDSLAGLGKVYIENPLLQSMVVSGIIEGVGAVLGFAPLILIMFIQLCFLEDLGYMARVAYMLDRVFKFFGLHGASVMPFIIAGGIPGGCAVPGVMTARTLRSPKERLATILTAPFMVCGAKVTVFLMFAKTFFPENAILVMLLLTVASWIFALVVAKILRSTVIKGEPTPFLMELPPYRFPTLYGVLIHASERAWQFVKKAGTVIFAISIVIWALMSFPELPKEKQEKFDAQRSVIVSKLNDSKIDISKSDRELLSDYYLDKVDASEQSEVLKNSYGGRIGTFLVPLSRYAGLPWQANIALLGGVAAKEVIVSTLSTAYSMDDSLRNHVSMDSFNVVLEKIQSKHQIIKIKISNNSKSGLEDSLLASTHWTLPAILGFFMFVLLYAPCLVTVVTTAKETSWKWALFGLVGSTVFAYVVAVLVYQIGCLFL